MSLLLFVVTGCQSVAPVLKIGLVGPFEGRERAVGYDVIYSARLAVREVNTAGGVAGYRLSLVALDDGGEPRMAIEAAESLALDPAVVAVIGHWLPQTTEAAEPVYAEAGLPFIQAGSDPFDALPPSELPQPFRQKYAEVTPFDETAGAYAGPAYDAFRLVLEAVAAAGANQEAIGRQAVARALPEVEMLGFGGRVYWP